MKKIRKWVVVYYGEELPYFCDPLLYDTKTKAELSHPVKERVQGIYPVLLGAERL